MSLYYRSAITRQLSEGRLNGGSDIISDEDEANEQKYYIDGRDNNEEIKAYNLDNLDKDEPVDLERSPRTVGRNRNYTPNSNFK